MCGVHPKVHRGTCEKICENSMFGVQIASGAATSMFFVFNLSKSPIFSVFQEIELSAHSALMGGQFPAKKDPGAFKNPIFYAGKFFGIS